MGVKQAQPAREARGAPRATAERGPTLVYAGAGRPGRLWRHRRCRRRRRRRRPGRGRRRRRRRRRSQGGRWLHRGRLRHLCPNDHLQADSAIGGTGGRQRGRQRRALKRGRQWRRSRRWRGRRPRSQRPNGIRRISFSPPRRRAGGDYFRGRPGGKEARWRRWRRRRRRG